MSPKLANRHVLIVGASGSGKTTAELKELVEEALRHNSAMICIDPHVGSLAESFFDWLCYSGLESRILYDRLSDLDRVLKWDFLSPSRAHFPRERAGENDNRCREFADLLLRRRGKASLAETPGIEEWTLVALGLYIHQRQRRPLSDIRYAFSFDHPTCHAMLKACADPDIVHKLESVRDDGQTPYKAAERLINGVCSSPAFHYRTAHSGDAFDFDRHLDNKGILIVEGGAGGSLSHDAMQTMMGAVILKTLNYIRSRKREYPHVTVAIDEANNANLIGESGHEVRALAELRKYGLGVHILIQFLDFPSSKITDAVMTNCATRKYFYCPEPRTATRLGTDLGGSYTSSGYSTRYSKDGSSWKVPTEVDNPYATELRNLGVGECYVREQNRTFKTKVQPITDAFYEVSERARRTIVSGYLQVIKQGPEYYVPDEPPPIDPSPGTQLPDEDDDGPFRI